MREKNDYFLKTKLSDMQAAAVEVARLKAEVRGSEAEVKALRALMELREQESARLHAKVREVEEEAEGLKSGSRAAALALQVYTHIIVKLILLA